MEEEGAKLQRNVQLHYYTVTLRTAKRNILWVFRTTHIQTRVSAYRGQAASEPAHLRKWKP